MINSSEIAAKANESTYNSEEMSKYIDGAPHIKHSSLRTKYKTLASQIINSFEKKPNELKVLDLGAGEGSATLVFLELGAQVVAVDISGEQLKILKTRSSKFSNQLTIEEQDVEKFIKSPKDQYDIVVVNSFLHHIPDYLELINKISSWLKPDGVFFSFQDPLRYDTLGIFNKLFSRVAYYSWRILGGDLIGGMKRYIRRKRGVYMENCEADNVEYHVVRNGLDQNSILKLLDQLNFKPEIISYFSTQNAFFQLLGEKIGIQNTFSIIAKKHTK